VGEQHTPGASYSESKLTATVSTHCFQANAAAAAPAKSLSNTSWVGKLFGYGPKEIRIALFVERAGHLVCASDNLAGMSFGWSNDALAQQLGAR
jgi:hypothetical protein